jgi:hypothetical protein
MKLIRLALKVQPACDHPMFWEWEFGQLYMWLFADSDEDAAERASAILKQLPYEEIGEAIGFRDCNLEKPDPRDEFKQRETVARQLGLALFLDSLAPGVADDHEFQSLF